MLGGFPSSMRCPARSLAVLGRALVFLVLASILSSEAARAELDVDTAAARFGARPAVWGMRLSPDGHKVVFLTRHPEGFPIALTLDLRVGKPQLILASDVKKQMDINWCRWANDERILCGYYGINRDVSVHGNLVAHTRLVGVNEDGSEMKVLLQRHQDRDEGSWSNDQDNVVDWLPGERKYVWVNYRERNGYGVSRLDIYKNRLKPVVRPKDGVWSLVSDGRGEIRARLDFDRTHVDLQYRLAGENKWRALHRYESKDLSDDFGIAGFGKDPNELYLWDAHEGRRALFRERLASDASESSPRTLVYSHPEVDLDGLVRLGRSNRIVGVAYTTDVTRYELFDAEAKALYRRLEEELGDLQIGLIDESDDRRFYLVHASSDVDAGGYLRYDREADALSVVTRRHPWIDEEIALAPMRSVRYAGKDGTSIPGYVTRSRGAKGATPLVVLPHGGPSSRDAFGYDPLVQYFATQGYTVLQANYRGSDGYGDQWEGEGAFKGWRTVVADLDAGVDHLVKEGLVDPERVCAVGWSFGGYAALMATLARPDRYRCVVSIAGVTHPHGLYRGAERGRFGRALLKEFIPQSEPEISESSPLKRAEELRAPALLLHGDLDLNVPVGQTESLARALERHGKTVEYVEYEDVDHHFRRQEDKIDLFQRVGEFLHSHLKAAPKKSPVAASDPTARAPGG